MPTPAQFIFDGKYEVLRDSYADETYYACTSEDYIKRREVLSKYDNDESKVPDDYIMNVIPFYYTGQMVSNRHIYKLREGIVIELQINRLVPVALRLI